VQVVAVCDPVKDGTNYVDWDKAGLRDSVRQFLGIPDWGGGAAGIRAGRDIYADFRELLERESDVNSVKVMTPDHLHATIAIAAMRKRRHVAMHKPLANRVAEVRMVVDAAQRTAPSAP
jgi:predicted dehydrogenase